MRVATAAKRAADRETARAKALSHPLRHEILLALAEREASPKELADETGAKLHTVMYHFRWLAGREPANDVPLIELIDTDTRNGGIQHIWKAIERPLVNRDAAADLPRSVREESSASIIPRVVDDIIGAQRAGTFDAHPQRSLLRFHGEFDEEGMQQAAQAAEAHLAAMEEIAAESANRIANGADGFPVASETLVFQVPGIYWTGT
jgi:hypothetical protein